MQEFEKLKGVPFADLSLMELAVLYAGYLNSVGSEHWKTKDVLDQIEKVEKTKNKCDFHA